MGFNMASSHKFLWIFLKHLSVYFILIKKNFCDLNLGEGLCIFTFFLLTDSGLFSV